MDQSDSGGDKVKWVNFTIIWMWGPQGCSCIEYGREKMEKEELVIKLTL